MATSNHVIVVLFLVGVQIHQNNAALINIRLGGSLLGGGHLGGGFLGGGNDGRNSGNGDTDESPDKVPGNGYKTGLTYDTGFYVNPNGKAPIPVGPAGPGKTSGSVTGPNGEVQKITLPTTPSSEGTAKGTGVTPGNANGELSTPKVPDVTAGTGTTPEEDIILENGYPRLCSMGKHVYFLNKKKQCSTREVNEEDKKRFNLKF